jgi:ribonuclease HI
MIKIYTDGSCLKNPGKGGWAAIINNEGNILKISGNEKETTNNKMELIAPIKALQKIKKNELIEIYTDSKYVKSGITEWVHKWIKNNWKTSKKEDVKNKELWLELYELSKLFKIKWIWVKAHAGNPINEEVDLLAKKAAKSNLPIV